MDRSRMRLSTRGRRAWRAGGIGIVAACLFVWAADAAPPPLPTAPGTTVGAPEIVPAAGRRRKIRDRRHKLLKLYDKNRDGVVTTIEIAKDRLQYFAVLDVNADSVIQRKEYMVLQRFDSADTNEVFDTFDADGDDVISRMEFINRYLIKLRMFDIDRNNSVTEAEIQLFKRIDQMRNNPRLLRKNRRLSK